METTGPPVNGTYTVGVHGRQDRADRRHRSTPQLSPAGRCGRVGGHSATRRAYAPAHEQGPRCGGSERWVLPARRDLLTCDRSPDQRGRGSRIRALGQAYEADRPHDEELQCVPDEQEHEQVKPARAAVRDQAGADARGEQVRDGEQHGGHTPLQPAAGADEQ